MLDYDSRSGKTLSTADCTRFDICSCRFSRGRDMLDVVPSTSIEMDTIPASRR